MVSAARNAVVQAAAELGSVVPGVRWFHAIQGGQPARGWFCSSFSDSVWISASLAAWEVPSVVRHECQHRQDYLAGRPFDEKAAGEFAARYEISDGRAFGPRRTTFVSPPT